MLAKNKRLAALAWAAAQADLSYGRLTVNLTHQDKAKIYKQYQSYLEKKAAEEDVKPRLPEEQKEPPRKRGRKRKIMPAQA